MYDMHVAFGRFFHVARFRHVQALCGAIITGSQALAFMGLYGWASGSDLDIAVSPSGVARLVSFLISEGYEYAGASVRAAVDRLQSVSLDDGYVSSRSVLGVLKLKRTLRETVTDVDVIVAVSPLDCILSFHSSARGSCFTRDALTCLAAVVMNGIAWDCAFALFPRATFLLRRGLVTVTDVGSREREALAKYRARGFRLAREWALVGSRDLGEFMPMQNRRVGDSGCWMIYFDSPIHPLPMGAERVQGNAFRIWCASLGAAGQLKVSAFSMDAVVVSSRLLTYRYTAPVALCVFAGGVLFRLECMAKDLGWGGELADFASFVHV